jgi:hypothetical protein
MKYKSASMEWERPMRLRFDKAHAAFGQSGQIDMPLRKLELPGLQFRQIQHFIDQAEEMGSAVMDVPGIILVIPGDGPKGRVLDDFGKAHDCVQGRAQFVTHVGEEIGLGLVRTFRRDPGRREIRKGLFPPAKLQEQEQPHAERNHAAQRQPDGFDGRCLAPARQNRNIVPGSRRDNAGGGEEGSGANRAVRMIGHHPGMPAGLRIAGASKLPNAQAYPRLRGGAAQLGQFRLAGIAQGRPFAIGDRQNAEALPGLVQALLPPRKDHAREHEPGKNDGAGKKNDYPGAEANA